MPERLEIALEPNAARALVTDLARKLELWTGRRWTVIVSNEAGQPTLRSQNEQVRNEHARAPFQCLAHRLARATVAPDHIEYNVATLEQTCEAQALAMACNLPA